MCRNELITDINIRCSLLLDFLCYRIAAAKCNCDFIFADSIYLCKDSAKKIIVKLRQRLEVFQEFPCRFFTEYISAVVVLLLSQFFKLTGIFAFLTIECLQFVTHMLKCTAADGSKDCFSFSFNIRQLFIDFFDVGFHAADLCRHFLAVFFG